MHLDWLNPTDMSVDGIGKVIFNVIFTSLNKRGHDGEKQIMHAFYNRYFRVAQLCITLSGCARHSTEESHWRHAKMTVTPESDRECVCRVTCGNFVRI